ncbi:fucolectin-6-like [Littorina saxatilis]|uniref:fucolectin-6-like n=1 Tax=Littorina saxatilis TaxID=31220 RepID=UPI0038B68DC4
MFLLVVADNVAVNKPASQISTFPGHNAGSANDGSFNNYIGIGRNGVCSHTSEPAIAGVRNWWQVDLEACYAISSVVITTRGDGWAKRLHDFDVDVYDKDPEMYPNATAQRCYHYVGSMPSGATEELVCENRPICGHVVRVTNAPGEFLTLCEVQVMAVP